MEIDRRKGFDKRPRILSSRPKINLLCKVSASGSSMKILHVMGQERWLGGGGVLVLFQRTQVWSPAITHVGLLTTAYNFNWPLGITPLPHTAYPYKDKYKLIINENELNLKLCASYMYETWRTIWVTRFLSWSIFQFFVCTADTNKTKIALSNTIEIYCM